MPLTQDEPPLEEEDEEVPQIGVSAGNGKQTTSLASQPARSPGGQQNGGLVPGHSKHAPDVHAGELPLVHCGTPPTHEVSPPEVLPDPPEVPHIGVPGALEHIAASDLQVERFSLSQQKGGPEVPHITHSVGSQLGNKPLVHCGTPSMQDDSLPLEEDEEVPQIGYELGNSEHVAMAVHIRLSPLPIQQAGGPLPPQNIQSSSLGHFIFVPPLLVQVGPPLLTQVGPPDDEEPEEVPHIGGVVLGKSEQVTLLVHISSVPISVQQAGGPDPQNIHSPELGQTTLCPLVHETVPLVQEGPPEEEEELLPKSPQVNSSPKHVPCPSGNVQQSRVLFPAPPQSE